MITSIQDVLQFWFANGMAGKWFGGGDAFDAQVRDHFGSTLQAAAVGELQNWKDTVEGRLALVIVWISSVATSIAAMLPTMPMMQQRSRLQNTRFARVTIYG